MFNEIIVISKSKMSLSKLKSSFFCNYNSKKRLRTLQKLLICIPNFFCQNMQQRTISSETGCKEYFSTYLVAIKMRNIAVTQFPFLKSYVENTRNKILKFWYIIASVLLYYFLSYSIMFCHFYIPQIPVTLS